MGRAFMENRNGLAVGGGVSLATGTAEREEALAMIDKYRLLDGKGGKRRITLAVATRASTWRLLWMIGGRAK